MVLCAMYSYIIYPNMVKMQHFVFELRLLQLVDNQRPCIVTTYLWQITYTLTRYKIQKTILRQFGKNAFNANTLNGVKSDGNQIH